jgi:hypothetical protein
MWPPQRGVGSLEPNLRKQIVVFICVNHYLMILFFLSPLSLSSLAYSLFEFAPKVICID